MKKRTQISINPELINVAKEIMAVRKFDNFSGLIEALIREEWERKGGGKIGQEQEAFKLNQPPASPSSSPGRQVAHDAVVGAAEKKLYRKRLRKPKSAQTP